MKTASPPVWRN